jgi:hypothetical protein
MKRFFLLLLVSAVSLSYVGIAQPTKTSKASKLPDPSMVLDYYSLLLRIVKNVGLQPTESARLFGYSGLALYEATVPSQQAYRSLVGQLNGLDYLPKGSPNQVYLTEVLAFGAMRRTLSDMILNNRAFKEMGYYEYMVKAPTDSLLQKYQTRLMAQYAKHQAYGFSLALGDSIAKTVFKYSLHDGGHREHPADFREDFRHYESPEGATWHDSQMLMKFSLQPTWGKNRTFIKDIHATAQAPSPIAYSTDKNSIFYAQALEVYDNCRDQNFEKRLIAEYWKDSPNLSYTPPGHMICLLSQLLAQQKADFGFVVTAYAKLGIALSDAFVCCWKTKYETNCIRPETYIQQNIDPRFKPPIPTPHFPEYTSGHSVQSGAAAEVLSALFGENHAFVDNTPTWIHERESNLLKPRSFRNFREMAREASFSRLYGGIHFRQACEVGLWQGETIGKQVNALTWKTATPP